MVKLSVKREWKAMIKYTVQFILIRSKECWHLWHQSSLCILLGNQLLPKLASQERRHWFEPRSWDDDLLFSDPGQTSVFNLDLQQKVSWRINHPNDHHLMVTTHLKLSIWGRSHTWWKTTPYMVEPEGLTPTFPGTHSFYCQVAMTWYPLVSDQHQQFTLAITLEHSSVVRSDINRPGLSFADVPGPQIQYIFALGQLTRWG